MADYKDISEIKRDWNAGIYQSHITIPATYSAIHVFDENLTIKENRRMIDEHNANVAKLKREKMEENSKLSKKFKEDIIAYLMYTYGFTEAQAYRVETYVYTEKHSFMCDYFSALDDIAEMVSDVINTK